MTLSISLRLLTRCLLAAVGLLTLSNVALSQQVTYYDFDSAQTNGNFSHTCGTLAPTTPILCFNDVNGLTTNPSFFTDTFPAKIDPDQTQMPPVPSSHTAVQLTPATTDPMTLEFQAGSMWFSVPQKVSGGFTSYFAFRMTPNANSQTTADGLAFVIQNSAGGGSSTTTDEPPVCAETGSGLSVIGGAGGCIGYGGIDNSLAFELDTFQNGYDPANELNAAPNGGGNHIAVQNCGAGLANSPDHTGSCLVQLNSATPATTMPAINSQLAVMLADGNVHEVVIEYSGPTEATPNRLRIYIDPPFVSGTHTPVATAVPVIDGIYDIAANLNLINSGSANDSAYVGFTAATGLFFEQHEVLAWTFTPHAPSVQQQPLAPPGQPTVFPFGTHTFAVTYPVGGPSTNNIDMILEANTITPAVFAQLSVGRPYAGSQCQVYDDTGGNCIIYSATCVFHGTNTITPCPAITGPSTPITIKSAYNNTIQPVSPGFLQGDPLFGPLDSVTGNGTVATVNCVGECSVTVGQTVTLIGVMNGQAASPFNGNVTVLTADPNTPNTFTFSSTITGSGTGGFVASNNVQNVFTSFVPQRIDGSTTGKTKNFSDFVVTSVTTEKLNSTTTVSSVTPNPIISLPVTVAFTVTSTSGSPTGAYTVTSSTVGDPSCTGTLSGGNGSCSLTFSTPGARTLTIKYLGDTNFSSSSTTAPVSVAGGAVAQVTPSAVNFGNVRQNTVAVRLVTLKNIGSAPMTITDKFLQIVGGGNSNLFVAVSLCPRSLAAGKSCTITVSFVAKPSSTPQTATLMIMDNAVSNPQLVPLSATVVKHTDDDDDDD